LVKNECTCFCTHVPTISSSATFTIKRSSGEVLDTSDVYHSEYERVKTFASWPVKFISHNDNSAAGYCYIHPPGHKFDICDCGTSYTDRVRGAFCGLMLEKWGKGDVPMMENQKWAPSCRFEKEKTVKKPTICSEVMCSCECEGDVCRSPPYDRHCNIVNKRDR
jgi:hypothetical protein